jgi:hypothetical protein
MLGRLHRAALALAHKGILVLPCVPCGKTPATAHGLKDATTDQATIARWWVENPGYNIGAATGHTSGFFAIDIDGSDGEAVLRSLERDNGTLPQTVEVITGGGGRHLYFSMPSTAIANSAGKVGPHIDGRANGGYVLAPPSIHPSGRRYHWSVDTANRIAAAPDWLLAKIAPSDGAGSNEATPPSEWRQLATDGVAEGKRNDSIARLTGHLLRRYVDPWVALELVRTWNATRCRPPLADKEVHKACKDNFLAKTAKDYACLRRWFGFLPRGAA